MMGGSSVKKVVGGVMVALALLYGFSSILVAAPPSWWAERGVINTNAPSEDYAAVTLGQLRHIAQRAYEEMATHYPEGAGPELDALVTSAAFTGGDNYTVVNVGQVKNIAKPFYDRLGLSYAWEGSTNASDDYALANIGQVKLLFSFVVNHAPVQSVPKFLQAPAHAWKEGDGNGGVRTLVGSIRPR